MNNLKVLLGALFCGMFTCKHMCIHTQHLRIVLIITLTCIQTAYSTCAGNRRQTSNTFTCIHTRTHMHIHSNTHTRRFQLITYIQITSLVPSNKKRPPTYVYANIHVYDHLCRYPSSNKQNPLTYGLLPETAVRSSRSSALHCHNCLVWVFYLTKLTGPRLR